MNKSGIISDKGLQGKYCISLDSLDDRSYDRLNYGVIALILFSQIGNGILGLLIIVYPKDPSLGLIWYIFLILTGIPYVLPFIFHAKSVLTIYQTTKDVPNLEVNLKMMTLHMVLLLLLALTIAVQFTFLTIDIVAIKNGDETTKRLHSAWEHV